MKKPNNSWFLYQLFPTTYLSILLTALLFPVEFYLPAWWSWENGPWENHASPCSWYRVSVIVTSCLE